jgi:hypothetical protein
MTEATAINRHLRPSADDTRASYATRNYLRRCAVGVFALVLAGLPLIGLGAPAVGRADGNCARAGVGAPN